MSRNEVNQIGFCSLLITHCFSSHCSLLFFPSRQLQLIRMIARGVEGDC